MASTPLAPQVDAQHFRSVMSRYPTGVVVITGLTPEGERVGMVIGSFSSLSLDPPLIAFAPSRSSSTYARFDLPRGFIVNVLSTDQEHICRSMSAKTAQDRWAGIGHELSPSGLPRLDGCLAWIHCTPETIHPAGDHDLVLGRVEGLQMGTESAPLIFFQGAYGRFASVSLTAPIERDLARQLRIADVARPQMEDLAARLGVECLAQARVGDELIHIATATSRHNGGTSRVGTRVPLAPPFGHLHMAWSSQDDIEEWLQRRQPKATQAERNAHEESLRLVRERGWSLGLTTPVHPEIARAIADYTLQDSDDDRLRRLMNDLTEGYEPRTIEASSTYPVQFIGVPIFGRSGAVELTLKVLGLAPEMTGAEVLQVQEEILRAAGEVSARLRDAPL